MKILSVFDSVQKFYEKRRGFQKHRRLKVFWNKGCTCVWCGLTGNKIVKSKIGKQIHYDLYYWGKDKRVLITVDHIIPQSLGGSWDLSNLQPMCSKCNSKKGNTIWLPYSILRDVEEQNLVNY